MNKTLILTIMLIISSCGPPRYDLRHKELLNVEVGDIWDYSGSFISKVESTTEYTKYMYAYGSTYADGVREGRIFYTVKNGRVVAIWRTP